MTRLYLTLMLAAAALGARADVLNFGYCTDNLSGLSHNQADVWLAGAIRIPAAQSAAFEGNSISKVSIGFGASTPKRVTVFLTHDLSQEPFYTQTANLKVNRFNDVPLTTPYALGEDRDLYIGYKIQTTMASDYPVGWDFCEVRQSPEANWFSSSLDEGELLSSWVQLDPHYGNVCIRAVIEGDNLADWHDCARPIDAGLPGFARPYEPFNVSVALQNMGVADLTSVRLIARVADEAPQVFDIGFDTPLVPGKCVISEIEGLVTAAQGRDLPVSFTVTEANGTANQYADCSIERPLLSSPNYRNKVVVMEEGTGTWCSWCPMGYVALEQMRDTHRDGSYIGIAVHNKAGRDYEPMHCDAYQEWIDRYITGFPKATVNRRLIFSPDPSGIEDVYKAFNEMPVEAMVGIEADYTGDSRSEIDVKVTAEVLRDMEAHNYGIALVITEDNVGPYMQANGFAGGSTPMGGFENLGGYAQCMYNDVARDIFDWRGNTSALPETLAAAQQYTYERTLPLTHVDDPAQAHVIALLINTETEEIENAATCMIGRSGVGMTAAAEPSAALKVAAGRGVVLVQGDWIDSFELLDMGGNRVARLDGPGAVNVPAGLYVVRAEGEGLTRTAKVAVR